MTRLWWILAMLVGCAWESDPNADERPLSSLPTPVLTISADLRNVRVLIEYDTRVVPACPVLDASFLATLAAVPMTIARRGASVDSIYTSDPCSWPELDLADPPAMTHAVIELTYPRHAIWVDLLDRLTPRSTRPVPDGPWAFTPGQTITVQWSPASDLTTYVPSVYFVTDDSPETGIRYFSVPVTIAGDQMTLTLPVVRFAGSLQFTLDRPISDAPRLGCTGASCNLVQTPRIVQPITWLTPAP